MKITFELDTNNPEENLDAVFAAIKNCFPAQATKTEPRTQDEDTSVPEFDDTGVPYDPRIHSTPAKINTDGRWRRRKNIEDAAFHHVMSEIVPPPPPPMARGSVIPKPPVTSHAPAPQNEFTKMMLRVSDLLTKGLLTHEKIEEFTRSINCTVNGKGMIAKLKDKPDLIPLFNNLVEDHVRKTAPK